MLGEKPRLQPRKLKTDHCSGPIIRKRAATATSHCRPLHGCRSVGGLPEPRFERGQATTVAWHDGPDRQNEVASSILIAPHDCRQLSRAGARPSVSRSDGLIDPSRARGRRVPRRDFSCYILHVPRVLCVRLGPIKPRGGRDRSSCWRVRSPDAGRSELHTATGGPACTSAAQPPIPEVERPHDRQILVDGHPCRVTSAEGPVKPGRAT